ncbi:hypothetical protein GGI07_004137 [Coemansia sp. Benny D115]|nr:hypothetical protein GGI07_004137 [Coemansia sp. Benny D115]
MANAFTRPGRHNKAGVVIIAKQENHEAVLWETRLEAACREAAYIEAERVEYALGQARRKKAAREQARRTRAARDKVESMKAHIDELQEQLHEQKDRAIGLEQNAATWEKRYKILETAVAQKRARTERQFSATN